MREIIETDFAEPIDLVVDDASHFYEETKAAFFPDFRAHAASGTAGI